jgi:D-tyrosyl-tRNA(Tyr) deacylase
MRAVVQRIRDGRVVVEDRVAGAIDRGLLIYLGVQEGDSLQDVRYMVDKLTNLRIFEDHEEKMNLSVLEAGGGMLVVSQFTLLGDCRKGRRPNFSEAARPEAADFLYQEFVKGCREAGIEVATGVFQAQMNVYSVNDGPVTILVDSKKSF